MKKSYDEWKTTNPKDEELRPAPEEKDDLDFRKIIDAKDAEIKGLKENIKELEEDLLTAVGVCNENIDLDRLIISLANAAASYLSFDGSDKIYDAVKLQGARVKLRAEIQSARDATR